MQKQREDIEVKCIFVAKCQYEGSFWAKKGDCLERNRETLQTFRFGHPQGKPLRTNPSNAKLPERSGAPQENFSNAKLQTPQTRSIPNAVELRRKTFSSPSNLSNAKRNFSNAKLQTPQTRSVKLFQTLPTLQTRSVKLFQTLQTYQTRSIKLFQTLPTFKLFYVFLPPIKTTLKPDLIIEKWPENGLKDPLATYVHPCA